MVEKQNEVYQGHLTIDEQRFWAAMRIGLIGLAGCAYGAWLGRVQSEDVQLQNPTPTYIDEELPYDESPQLPTGKIVFTIGLSAGIIRKIVK